MKGDFSKKTFDAKKHFDAVNMQQGRVLLDADWNEQNDIADHCTVTESDGALFHVAGFEIITVKNGKDVTSNGEALKISACGFYVDGILARRVSSQT